MIDKRDFWQTKTFLGMVVFVGSIAAEWFLGYELGELKVMALGWMGWSVTERFRKK